MSIPFLLDEKPTVVPVGLAGEQSGDKRKVSYGDTRSNSERAAPSACVGRRFSASQIVWNRSPRRAGCPARELPRLGTRWQAVPERERFYCATSRWAPARHESGSDVNAGAAPAQPSAP